PPPAIEEVAPAETRIPEAPEHPEPPAVEPPPVHVPVSAAPAPTAPPAPARAPATPPPGFEEMRGVKVLGKIDLRKPSTPAASPPQRAGETPGTTTEGGGEAPKKKKGRKVIKKSDMLDTMERDFNRPGKRPQKRRALPGKEQKKTEITVPRASKRVIRISEVITVADLARGMGVKAGDVLKKLL